jgi:hypothetical protein
MCNCGNKRASLNQHTNLQSEAMRSKKYHSSTNGIKFQYIGKTALSAIGSITGKQYRFNFTGDIQLIDSRDVYSMAAITVLKKIDES